MSWQLGAFSVLAVSLGAGFGWYERSRPDARLVALVAALAAFAALGRIAFAALPNVKPTTDIVLVAGFVLGAAPGFVVGALAGVSSNFFFGQGPWTPWQMAAWGVCGLLGAGLGHLLEGRPRRVPLALACGVVGFGFAAVQDVGDWVTYSDHSVAQLGIYVGKGIGFDLVHAGGCVAFALAFAPALGRSLARAGRRLRVQWGPISGAGEKGAGEARAVAGLLSLAVAVALAGLSLADLQGVGAAQAAQRPTPTQYLLRAQRSDGGFGSSPSAASSPLYAGWAALGLEAAGRQPATTRRARHSLLDYIRLHSGSSSDVGSLERTILVVRAAGIPATRFGGRNLLAALAAKVGKDGSVSEQVNLTAFAILALRAGGASVPRRSIAWLASQQDRDGGFNFASAGGGSDLDDTGAALEALGRRGRLTRRAVAFLSHHQNRDGGFPSLPGGESNAQSTAWAVQGLLAARASGKPVKRGIAFLTSLIGADGHVHYSRTSDQTPVWVTAQALMALERKPLPLAPLRAPRAAVVSAATARPAAHRTVARAQRSAGGPQPRRHTRATRLLSSATSSLHHAQLQALAGEAGVAAAVLLAPMGV